LSEKSLFNEYKKYRIFADRDEVKAVIFHRPFDCIFKLHVGNAGKLNKKFATVEVEKNNYRYVKDPEHWITAYKLGCLDVELGIQYYASVVSQLKTLQTNLPQVKIIFNQIRSVACRYVYGDWNKLEGGKWTNVAKV
jgi:hypothetical protein